MYIQYFVPVNWYHLSYFFNTITICLYHPLNISSLSLCLPFLTSLLNVTIEWLVSYHLFDCFLHTEFDYELLSLLWLEKCLLLMDIWSNRSNLDLVFFIWFMKLTTVYHLSHLYKVLNAP